MNSKLETKIFSITESGFDPDSDKVASPACRIKARSYKEAIDILNKFLSTRIKPDELELITPIENIDFE